MLSFKTSESELAFLFSPFGPISEVVLLHSKDLASTSKGSAIIKYSHYQDAQAAVMALDKQAVDPVRQ